jgi:hypothetical protein
MVMKGNNPSCTIFGEAMQENIPNSTRDSSQPIQGVQTPSASETNT